MCSFNVSDFLKNFGHSVHGNTFVLLWTYFWWLRNAPRLGAFFPHSLQMCSDSASKCLAMWPRRLFWCFSLESETFRESRIDRGIDLLNFWNYHAEQMVHWTLLVSTPLCWRRCCCRHCLLLNIFAHTSQIKMVLLLWTLRICDCRIDLVINLFFAVDSNFIISIQGTIVIEKNNTYDFKHVSQTNFFSSEKCRCFWCCDSWYRLTKLWSQLSHLYARWSGEICPSMWFKSDGLSEKFLLHFSQLQEEGNLSTNVHHPTNNPIHTWIPSGWCV